MKISFHGATREVTGSCYLVETKQARILVDCGMFQGSAFSDAKNFQDFPFDASTIDAVIVTHAHLDHVGRIPKLVKEKFNGSVHLTRPTAKIAQIVIENAEQIMDDDFRREARPKLYERKDGASACERMVGTDYGKPFSIGDLTLTFHDAGHIFGSAFIEVTEKGGPTVIFSGDVGNRDVPILHGTEQIPRADVVITESTYGNRIHEDESTRSRLLKEAIITTVKQKGALVIPAFAVERTQQILYELNTLIEKKELPPVNIFMDSPMAIAVSEVIEEFPSYYNEEALRLIRSGDDFFQFPGLHITKSRDESKTINASPKPKIIIAGSGMMNGGRIQHHLVRYLGDPKSCVLIIGYQAHGTLGHRLYAGEKNVTVLGERITVKARIESIGAYSAHADQQMLVDWIGRAASKPSRVFCTHGEEAASAALATRITTDLGITADVPRLGDTVTL